MVDVLYISNLTFRSPKTGLYANVKKYKLPYPEAIFDVNYFKMRPSAFYALARELYPTGKYRPNVAHYFCRLLNQKRLLRRLYTQNIDGLERVAGIPPSKLVEAHGTFTTAQCLECEKSIPARMVKAAIDKGKVARCYRCSGLVKPDVVFYNEDLPAKFWRYREDFPKGDLIIVMGTSLEVQPFSRLIFASLANTPRVLFNKHIVGPFKTRRRPKDFVALGDISALIRELCALLEWTDELENLIKDAELKRIDYIGLSPLNLSKHHRSKGSKSTQNSHQIPSNISHLPSVYVGDAEKPSCAFSSGNTRSSAIVAGDSKRKPIDLMSAFYPSGRHRGTSMPSNRCDVQGQAEGREEIKEQSVKYRNTEIVSLSKELFEMHITSEVEERR